MVDSKRGNSHRGVSIRDIIYFGVTLFLVGISWGNNKADIINLKEDMDEKANKELLQVKLENIEEKVNIIYNKYILDKEPF